MRSCFYECVSSVVDSQACSLPLTCQAIRTGLTDQESSVLPFVFSAFLHLATSQPICWQHLGCGSPKPISDRLLRLIKDGFRGVAEDIAPNILPVLSVMPESSLADSAAFYSQLLDGLTNCLLTNELLSSRQQFSAVSDSLFECIRFLSKHRLLPVEFWESVVSEQLIPILLLAFKNPRHLSSESIYEKIASLSLFWSKQVGAAIGNPDNKVDDEKQSCQDLLTIFWQSCLQKSAETLLKEEPTEIEQLSQFLNTVQNPSIYAKSKRSGVKFSENSPSSNFKEDDVCNADACSTDVLKTQFVGSTDVFKTQFVGCVESIQRLIETCFSLYHASGPQKLALFKIFSKLLSIFDCIIPVDFAQIESVILPELSGKDLSLQILASELFLKFLVKLPDREQTDLLGQCLVSSMFAHLYW